MRLGASILAACPRCAQRAALSLPASGSTRDAAWWSDGVLRGPMWPRSPELLCCSGCSALVWRGELAPVPAGDTATALRPPAWAEPTPARIWQALDEGEVTDASAARRMQLLAWQRVNDNLCWRQAARGGEARPADAAAGAPPHRLRLLNAALQGEDAMERLRKAEVLRQLGRFEQALLALHQVQDPAYAEWVQHLRALCEAGQTQLARMPLAC
jgi:hypothetical protein